MNILVVNWQDWDNTNAGGAEVHLYEVFSRLIRRGHSVVLLCSRGSKQTRYSDHHGFTIVRTGNRSNFNFCVPGILKRIIKTHEIDLICDDLNKIPFYSPWFIKQPVVALVHHLFRQTIYRETNPVLASYVYGTESIIPLCYHRTPFIAVSESTADDLKSMGIPAHNIHVVYNGIPIRNGTNSDQRQRDLIVYVGRIKRYKSIDHFLLAAALVMRQRSIRIKVVGEGDALDRLKSIAQQNGIPVQFTGFVGEDEKNRIYTQARIAVQPSIKEGWGLTALEAQSCGTPVICADSPGLREAVVNGKTGFLYPYGDIERFAQQMLLLLDDDMLWNNLSHHAREWSSQFSWDSAAQKIEGILEQILGAGIHG